MDGHGGVEKVPGREVIRAASSENRSKADARWLNKRWQRVVHAHNDPRCLDEAIGILL